MEEKAKMFTKGSSEILVNFLNTHKDLPIVAHPVDYDRDEVLKEAFEKVGNLERLPGKERWRCTWEMADRVPFLVHGGLDDLLEHFGHPRSDLEAYYDAMEDCILTAKVYMDIVKIPEKKERTHGFAHE